MRKIALLKYGHCWHKIFCFILGVFVGLQMYGTFWIGYEKRGGRSDPSRLSPLQYLFDSRWSSEKILVSSNETDSKILHINISLSKETALKTLAELNLDQKIRNVEKFPLRFDNDSVVILIQVHNRKEDLEIMINSLKHVRYINQTLVIFSHDYFSKEIFELVQSIDFCPVLQLFYPYSVQFYNDRFPGDSKNDCPRDIGKPKALEIGCYNAKYPDTYNHYRQGRVTQIKHHWLWKIHFIFDKVRILKDFQGTVLRLDEDYFLSEDAIHVIRALNDIKPVVCPSCLMYILGEHENLKPTTYVSETGEAIISNYFIGIGRGMAFRRAFWDVFKSCAASFCKYDDYNWDWSLEHVTTDCFREMRILKPKAGRIFHIGTCHGFHRNIHNCDKNKVKTDIETTLLKYKQNLYPKTFKVSTGKGRSRKLLKGYGGWKDPRDQELCMKFFNNDTDSDEMLTLINKIIAV